MLTNNLGKAFGCLASAVEKSSPASKSYTTISYIFFLAGFSVCLARILTESTKVIPALIYVDNCVKAKAKSSSGNNLPKEISKSYFLRGAISITSNPLFFKNFLA